MEYSHWVFYALFLLPFQPGVQAKAPAKVSLFNDYDCDHPSTLNPSVNLALDTCLVYPGCEGLEVDTLPPCTGDSSGNGTASHIFYEDASCNNPVDISTSILEERCYQTASGPTLLDSKSFMFTCDSPDNNPSPSSTTTAVVSQEAAVATGTNDGGSQSSAGSASSATTTAADGSSTSTPHSSTSPATGTNTGAPASNQAPSAPAASPSSSPSTKGGGSRYIQYHRHRRGSRSWCYHNRLHDPNLDLR